MKDAFPIKKYSTKNKTFYIHKKTKKKYNENNQFIQKLKKTIRIPPAYKNVQISNNLNAKVLVKGEDSRGRIQYLYNPLYTSERSIEKFKELVPFSKKIHKIRNDMMKTIQSFSQKDIITKELLIACCLYLIDECHFRVGNTKYLDLYESTGTTTLQSKHIHCINPSEMRIEFKGKKGVINKSIITHKKVILILETIKKQNKKYDFIFCYTPQDNVNQAKQCITERTINQYLKSYHPSLTVKMYRTWTANYDFLLHLKTLLQTINIEDQKQLKKGILETIKKIAPDYHHTATISRKSYLHEGIITHTLKHPHTMKKLLQPILPQKNILSVNTHVMDLLLYVSNK